MPIGSEAFAEDKFEPRHLVGQYDAYLSAGSLYVIVNTLHSEPNSVENKIRTDSEHIKAASNPQSLPKFV